MKLPSSKQFWQIVLWISLLFSMLAAWQTWQQVGALHIILWKSRWIVLFLGYLLNIVSGVGLLILLSGSLGDALVSRLDENPQGFLWKIIGAFLLCAGLSVLWFVRWRVFSGVLPQSFPALWVFWWGTLLAALGFKWLVRASWSSSLVSMLALQGLLFVTYGRLRLVTDNPFSIGYSESSRYYYASLLFSKSLYGLQLPLSALHPTRYFVMAVPFLIKGLPIWVDRLWQALLYLGLTAGASFALVWRLHLDRRIVAFLTAVWFLLYCFQGIVYYHLQVMVIIILLGVQPRHFWRSLIAILLASFWAGMSRINWFPVPAMLAILLYLLETPYASAKNMGRYLFRPVLWAVLGVATALLSQAWYIVCSGNAQNPEIFGSSLESPLLWNRLFPNASYPLGILPGILLVSFPLWFVIFFALRGRLSRLHWLRWGGMLAMLLVLFVGGLVVSVKIGGGAELHNMDAYMVLLGTCAAYLFAGRVASEARAASWGEIPWLGLLLAFLIPVAFAVANVTPYATYDPAVAAQDIQSLHQIIAPAVQQKQEVLFIGERQLLTFGQLPDVPLVPQYELVTLMEMAMSHNMDYLNGFYSDLHNHRFALIVARKQGTSIQDAGESFADENNAWNTMIAVPLLCEYQPVLTLKGVSVQVYAPRPGRHSCPGVP